MKHTIQCKEGKRLVDNPAGLHNYLSTEDLNIPPHQLFPCHLCWNPQPAETRPEYVNSKCFACGMERKYGDPAIWVRQGELPVYFKPEMPYPRAEIDELAAMARQDVEEYENSRDPLSTAHIEMLRSVEWERRWNYEYGKYRSSPGGQGPHAHRICDLKANGDGFLLPAEAPFNDVCAICKAPPNTERYTGQGVGNPRKLPCGHVFHFECIVEWMTYRGCGNCPYCRREWPVIFKNGFDKQVYRWFPARNVFTMVSGYIPFHPGIIGQGNFNPFLDPNRWGDENEEADYE
jgi:hypothetical protein